MNTRSTSYTLTNSELKTKEARTNILNIVRQLDLNKISNIDIIEQIAEGGFGTTHTCNYIGTISILKKLKCLDTKAFMDEFKITYKFRYPSIPKVISAYESKDSDQEDMGVIFEYIKGTTLGSLLYKYVKGKKKKTDLQIPLLQKINYLLQLAGVIEFLHDHDLVHRDLKPDNIIIDIFGNVKLIDFGISMPNKKVIDLNEDENCYSMKYVPVDLKYLEINGPEELKENKELKIGEKIKNNYVIDTAFDVWCIGLIIGELIFDTEPWNGKGENKIVGLICEIEDPADFKYPLPKDTDKKEMSKKSNEIILKISLASESFWKTCK